MEGGDKGWGLGQVASDRDLFRHPLSHARSPMDVDMKAGRIRAYVHAQLAFVPFYGADPIGPGDSLPEVLGLETPVLTARNPLVTIQPESNPPPVPIYLEDSRGGPTQAYPPLTKKPTENQKDRRVKRHLDAKERKRPLKLKSDFPSIPGPNPSNEPAKERTSVRKERMGRREKPRLPTSLSFLYGFAPKNVGPSRLTVRRLGTHWNAGVLITPRYRLEIRVFLEEESLHRP